MGVITEAHIEKSISYDELKSLSKELVEQGKNSGKIQNESLHNFSKLNNKRMDRLDKHGELDEALTEVVDDMKGKQIWIVLTETWCGDAAQNIPYIAKIAEARPKKIQLGFLFRDENPEVMDEFLTGNNRSIPKLIAMDEDLEVLWTWGPRPDGAQQLMEKFKRTGSTDKEGLLEDIQRWYNEDEGFEVQEEVRQKLAEQVYAAG